MGSKFFPFRVDPTFQKKSKIFFTVTFSTESVPSPFKVEEYIKDFITIFFWIPLEICSSSCVLYQSLYKQNVFKLNKVWRPCTLKSLRNWPEHTGWMFKQTYMILVWPKSYFALKMHAKNRRTPSHWISVSLCKISRNAAHVRYKLVRSCKISKSFKGILNVCLTSVRQAWTSSHILSWIPIIFKRGWEYHTDPKYWDTWIPYCLVIKFEQVYLTSSWCVKKLLDECQTVQTLIICKLHKMMQFFLFFPGNRAWHFMQTISLGDNLHECQSLFSGKNTKNISKCYLLKFLPSMLIVNYG